MIVAATGHRPNKLGGYGEPVAVALRSLARSYLSRAAPFVTVTGMAIGWDQAVAAASLDLGIPFIAAVPFEGQEGRWPAEAQKSYRALLSRAFRIHMVSDRPSAAAMQRRNEWMVEMADRMCALWDGSWGGTFNCVRYAERKGVPVENLWSQWSVSRQQV